MKPLSPEELKIYQMNILDTVAEFCEKNNIKYWIDSGTLLGAIRHGGYIPWDDDIDIGMLREDYDRFLSEFNETSEEFKVYSIENNQDFPYPFAKVLDLSTELYEPNKELGQKLNVNIDIFVYDLAPDDGQKLKKMYDKRDLLRRLHDIRNPVCPLSKNPVKKVVMAILRVLIKVFPKNFFMKKMAQNSKKYAAQNFENVGNFTAFSRISCSKHVFDECIDVKFEGRTYKMPAGYDEWLKAFYGDYMQLPPEEKRVSHHQFEAFAKIKGEILNEKDINLRSV